MGEIEVGSLILDSAGTSALIESENPLGTTWTVRTMTPSRDGTAEITSNIITEIEFVGQEPTNTFSAQNPTILYLWEEV
jgi:hypothetical protein